MRQVVCGECGRVSSREEAFCDLTISVDGLRDVEHSLQAPRHANTRVLI